MTLQTLFDTLYLRGVCFSWSSCRITILIRYVEVPCVPIHRLPFALGNDDSAIEILSLRHLAVTLHARHLFCADSTTSCKLLSWVALAFPSSGALVSAEELGVSVFGRVVQVV